MYQHNDLVTAAPYVKRVKNQHYAAGAQKAGPPGAEEGFHLPYPTNSGDDGHLAVFLIPESQSPQGAC